MGSSPSKPESFASTSTDTSRSTTEKQRSAIASLSVHHHAADRLARIEAESLQRDGKPYHNPDISMDGSVSLDAMKAWDAMAKQHPVTSLASLTLHGSDIAATLHRRKAEVAASHVFNHKIDMEGVPITNQMNSGRCWLFATTNILRLEVIKKLNLAEFQLSQSYLSFWDKLEKASFLLQNNIELADRPLNDRVLSSLIGPGGTLNEGGQEDMAYSLLKKYGILPQVLYPESFNSSSSSKINWLVTLKLREYVLELRALRKVALERLEAAGTTLSAEERQKVVMKQLLQRKDEQMAEVYRMMVIAFGNPPKPDEEFTYEYYDKQGKAHSLKSTPLKFLRDYSGSFEVDGACSLVDDPRRAPNQLITVSRLGNVWNGNPVLYVNTTADLMKRCVVAQIQAGAPVFFGCDVGQFSHTASGIMDTSLFGYEEAFGIKLGLSKAERLELGESSMTHAMVITGVHLGTDGKPVRYRVENSWGPNAGDQGFMTMSDDWFSNFVYQVVIRKKHVPAHLWKLYADGINDKTVILPPYDPFGALAK